MIMYLHEFWASIMCTQSTLSFAGLEEGFSRYSTGRSIECMRSKIFSGECSWPSLTRWYCTGPRCIDTTSWCTNYVFDRWNIEGGVFNTTDHMNSCIHFRTTWLDDSFFLTFITLIYMWQMSKSAPSDQSRINLLDTRDVSSFGTRSTHSSFNFRHAGLYIWWANIVSAAESILGWTSTQEIVRKITRCKTDSFTGYVKHEGFSFLHV